MATSYTLSPEQQKLQDLATSRGYKLSDAVGLDYGAIQQDIANNWVATHATAGVDRTPEEIMAIYNTYANEPDAQQVVNENVGYKPLLNPESAIQDTGITDNGTNKLIVSYQPDPTTGKLIPNYEWKDVRGSGGWLSRNFSNSVPGVIAGIATGGLGLNAALGGGILGGAGTGAATGALANLIKGDSILEGALKGAAGGAVTGAVMPYINDTINNIAGLSKDSTLEAFAQLDANRLVDSGITDPNQLNNILAQTYPEAGTSLVTKIAGSALEGTLTQGSNTAATAAVTNPLTQAASGLLTGEGGNVLTTTGALNTGLNLSNAANVGAGLLTSTAGADTKVNNVADTKVNNVADTVTVTATRPQVISALAAAGYPNPSEAMISYFLSAGLGNIASDAKMIADAEARDKQIADDKAAATAKVTVTATRPQVLSALSALGYTNPSETMISYFLSAGLGNVASDAKMIADAEARDKVTVTGVKPTANVTALTPEQIAALAATKIPKVEVTGGKSTANISALTSSQIADLSTSVIPSLTVTAPKASLTTSDLTSLLALDPKLIQSVVTTPAAKLATSDISSLTTSALGALTTAGLLSLLGGGAQALITAQQAKDFQKTLDTQATKIEAANTAAQPGYQFSPIGITTRFGNATPKFDANGKLVGYDYGATSDIAAQRDQLLKLSQQALPTTTDPTQLINNYIKQQQGLLAPGQQQDLATIQAQMAASGRAGLGTGATTATPGMQALAATNPQLAAYYNSLAQQNAQLTANAPTYAQNLLNSQISTSGTLFGQAQGLETAAQQPLTMGSNLGTAITAGTTNASNAAQLAAQQAAQLQAYGALGAQSMNNATTNNLLSGLSSNSGFQNALSAGFNWLTGK